MEWKEVRLGDVCSRVCSGGTPKSTNLSYYGGEIPWLNTKEIDFNRIYSTEKTITESGLSNSSAKWIVPNTVTVAMYGATAGKSCIVKVPMTTNQACCNLTINEEVADYEFIYYTLKNDYTTLASLANGGAQQNLNAQIIKDYVLQMPSLADQRRIASILSSLDRKIELNNKINADLEEMAQAIFKNWFVDFEPFKDGKFVDSELGMIPEGWKVGTLADIAEITMGQSPAGNSLNENREGMIFYQGSSDFGFRFPSIRVFTTEPKRLAVANSVLFSVRAPVGDINVAKEECCIGRGVASIKSKYGHDSYLFYTMKSLHKLFDSFDGEGTVFGSINKKTLSAIQILLPSDGIVEQFNNIASSFDDRIRSLSDESSRLSLLRDTLLPRLMSGELEVPE